MQIRDALNGERANPVPAVEALAVMAVLEAAVKSSETGQSQPLDLTRAEQTSLS
jgi:predicted dehydrogenase